MSSREVRISRIKGIQSLLGETCVTKDCPTAPVIHGTIHHRFGGGQSIGILRWRNIRRAPCVRLALRTWRWSLAGGGPIGHLSGHNPASALFPKRSTSLNIPSRNQSWEYGDMHYRCGGISVRTTLLFSLLGRAASYWLAATGSASRLKGTPCKTPLIYGDKK